MKNSAVIYIAGKDAHKNSQQIKEYYNESDFFVCPIKENYNCGENLLSPSDFIGDSYKNYAFCFKEEELFCFLALKISSFMLKKYSAVAIITDNMLMAPLPQESDALSVFPYVIYSEKTNLSTDISLKNQPLYCNYSFGVKGGKKVSEFFAWCEEKYNCLLFGNIETRRGFFKTWLSYLSLFGCSAQINSPAKAIDFSDYDDYSSFDDGIKIADILRGYFGGDYRLRNKCKNAPFADSKCFLNESVIVGDTQPIPVVAAQKAIYNSRTDLQALFSDLNDTETRRHFAEWYMANAQKEYNLPTEYITPLKMAYQTHTINEKAQSFGKFFASKNKAKAEDCSMFPFGINLCGFIKGDFGLGESMRIIARILEKRGIPYTIIEIQDSALHTFSNLEFQDKITNEFIYNTNLFVYNPDCFEDSIKQFDKNIFKNRYNIGYWAWEMPEFPEGWEDCFKYFNEIWTCSDFTTASIAQKSPVPVKTIPYAIDPQKDDSLTRADFGIPEDKFIFLLMYDVRSISERKNPFAAIKAFNTAFENRDDARLLIKLNVPTNWDGENGFVEELKKYKNIITISSQMSKATINALVSLCDAYVSLHRSEGFGLGPAEAMAFCKPIVITNYSGNTQYMRKDACCSVPYKLVEIEKDFGIYKKGMHWADADVNAAAQYMEKLVDDKNYYNMISENAKKVIENEFSYKNCGDIILKNIPEKLKR